MASRMLSVVVLASVAACATSETPSNDTDTDPTVTASFTSTGDTNDTNDTNATTNATNDTNTTTPATTSDDTTGSSGSSGSGGSSTGECVPGEQGCACTAEDPPCAEGLLCLEEVCAVPMCPADLDEPNDLQGETIHLVDINDGAAAQMHAGTLSGAADVDWWSYHCNDDTLVTAPSPVHTLTSDPLVRFCVFMDCDIGGNPILTNGCPMGSTEDTAPLDFMPGCCTEDGSTVDLSEYNCPDDADDSVMVYFRVDMPAEDVCVDYSIEFEC